MHLAFVKGSKYYFWEIMDCPPGFDISVIHGGLQIYNTESLSCYTIIHQADPDSKSSFVGITILYQNSKKIRIVEKNHVSPPRVSEWVKKSIANDIHRASEESYFDFLCALEAAEVDIDEENHEEFQKDYHSKYASD